MAAKDSAELCEVSEDMRDVTRQLARNIKELGESNQKIATEMKALANKVDKLMERRHIEDLCEESEQLFQVFPSSSKYHRCPVATRCCGGHVPDEELKFPVRIAKKLGRNACQLCLPLSPR